MKKHFTPQRLLLALALLLIGTWVLRHLIWEEVETRSGYSLAARRNPYHAGLLLLRQLGIAADTQGYGPPLPEPAAAFTLLYADTSVLHEQERGKALLDWVRRGGHLMLPSGDDPATRDLLRALGIPSLTDCRSCTLKVDRIEVEGQGLHIWLPQSSNVFAAPRTADWVVTLHGRLVTPPGAKAATVRPLFEPDPAWQTKNPPPPAHLALFARLPLGTGHVTVGPLTAFSNLSIGSRDNATLFTRLVTLPDAQRSVRIIVATAQPGLLRWLITQAPEVSLAALCLLLAALWYVAPRFGPLLPAPAPHRPGLGLHLAASGRFLLQHRAYDALIAPLRDDVQRSLESLRGRHPEIDEPARLGARLSGLDADGIANALAGTPLDRHQFLRQCRTLAALRSRLAQLRPTILDHGIQS